MMAAKVSMLCLKLDADPQSLRLAAPQRTGLRER